MRRQVFRHFPWRNGTRVASVLLDSAMCAAIQLYNWTSISYKGVRETAPYTTALRTICPERGKKSPALQHRALSGGVILFWAGAGRSCCEGSPPGWTGCGAWRRRREGSSPQDAQGDEAPIKSKDEPVVVLDAPPAGPGASCRRRTSSHRLSAAMVMSAISRAMAAPPLMAMPASASERAGESLMPSPTMRTVCPSRRRDATNSALSAGSTPAWKPSTPTSWAMAAAVRGLSPGEHDGLFHPQAPQGGKHFLCLLAQGVGDAQHGGQLSVDGQIQLGVLRRQTVRTSPAPPSGMTAFSSSKMKWALPMRTCSPSTELAMPWGHQVLHLGVALLVAQAPAAGLLHHGVGHGVGEVLLQAGGQPEHLLLPPCRRRGRSSPPGGRRG